MITVIAAPASSTARGLALPSSPATTDGSPNTPLPRMLLIASATMLQRPSARTSCGCAPRSGWVVTAPLYHKAVGTRGRDRCAAPPRRTQGVWSALFVCHASGMQPDRRALRHHAAAGSVGRQEAAAGAL